METTKKLNFDKRKELYKEVLLCSSKHFDKDVPTDLIDCLSRGPSSKYPIILCCFLMAVKELTGQSLYMILKQVYNIDSDIATPAAKRWINYYKDCPYLQQDIAMICMLIREKHCNNNKFYE